jgi:release factor glutamine methyltransferase
MSIAEAIRAAAACLTATSDTARLDAELLMAHALGVTRTALLIGLGRDDWAVPPEFDRYVDRRASHEPVAYILGEQEFYGHAFCVTPDVLIPRSDSEALIDAALQIAPGAKSVLDLGTGSGALLITLLLELSDARGVATDISEAALAIARGNALRHQLAETQARLVQGDWRAPGWCNELGIFDLIICNPPYVESDADLGPNVSNFEPHGALFAGPEGLDDYRILLPQIRALLTDNGIAIFEIGAAQGDAVSRIARASGFDAEIRCDLAQRPRLVVLR